MDITDEQSTVVQAHLPEQAVVDDSDSQRHPVGDRTGVSVHAELTLTPTVSSIATSQALPDTIGLTLQNVAAL